MNRRLALVRRALGALIVGRAVVGLALIAAAAGVTLTAAARPLAAQESGLALGAVAPGAKLVTLDGKPADLKAMVAQGPVLIEFWATWCSSCKELEPRLLAAQKKYAGKVRFVAVAVGVNQSAALVQKYVTKHGMQGITHYYDATGAAAEAYDVPATSHVVVVNKAGKVVYAGTGGTQDLDAAIRKAL